MSSASKKLRLEKAQQVPDWFWFLIDVIGFSFTVVNWNPSFFSCAKADVTSDMSAAAKRILFIFLVFMIVVSCFLGFWVNSLRFAFLRRTEHCAPLSAARMYI
jgi:hypothetical protein